MSDWERVSGSILYRPPDPRQSKTGELVERSAKSE